MALQIKDKTILRQIEHLSRTRQVSKTEIIRTALRHEIEQEARKLTPEQLLAPILARLKKIGTPQPVTPEEDKRFFDELWGE